MSNSSFLAFFLVCLSIIVVASATAHQDKHNRNTAKCKQMLKKYSYQSGYTGEYEVIHGDLFCYDSQGHLHQYKKSEIPTVRSEQDLKRYIKTNKAMTVNQIMNQED